MACMEHWCIACTWQVFDNCRATCCPTHGSETSRHTWDEQDTYRDEERDEDRERAYKSENDDD